MLNENNLTYKCPNCGGALEFDIKAQKVKCHHCGVEFDTKEVQEYEEKLKKAAEDKISWGSKTKEFSHKDLDSLNVYYCSTCGGNLITDENTTSTICPYCGSPVILTERLSGYLKPDYVIPFKQDKSEVVPEFHKYIKKKLFVKNDFITKSSMDKLQGIYAPYWLFTSDTEGSATFKGCIITTWSDTDYYYTKRSYYSIYREGSLGFDHVPHDGSKSISDALLESLEPFVFKEADTFKMQYLSGHVADKYDVTWQECEAHITERMRSSLTNRLRATVFGYSELILQSSSLRMINPNVEYALYPVWLFNTTYKDKKYSFGMNGQTGKMTGNLPMSIWKFIIWFISFWATTGGIIFLVTWLIAKDSGSPWPFWVWLIPILGGLVTPLIFCIYHAKKLKPVKKANNADDYIVKDSFHLDDSSEFFLYSTVTRTPIPKNNKS